MNRRRVLIETSWNVKADGGYTVPEDIQVLIETSWNVKKVGALVVYGPGGY